MSKQDLTDIQIVIDKLFGRLEGSSTGGELTQYNHALRVQITKKKKLGGEEEEKDRRDMKRDDQNHVKQKPDSDREKPRPLPIKKRGHTKFRH